MEKAIFAAGCYWGVQYYFDQVPGVISTVVGYIGGNTEDVSMDNIYTFATGHAEAVEVTFDPKIVSYKTLLKHFFRLHDPTSLNRQGPDIGDLYRSGIFYLSSTQKNEAEEVKNEAQKGFSKPIVTEITEATKFYPAEEYEQKFAQKTGIGLCHIPYKPLN